MTGASLEFTFRRQNAVLASQVRLPAAVAAITRTTDHDKASTEPASARLGSPSLIWAILLVVRLFADLRGKGADAISNEAVHRRSLIWASA